ncbi:MAG: fructose-bisphosphatase class II [Thermomicrobiales bacterium]
MITDGDVAGALMTTMPSTGIDVLMGIGGAPEAVIAACAMKCAGGEMQTRLWPRNDQERQIVDERKST